MEEAQKNVGTDIDEWTPLHDYQSRIYGMLRELSKYLEGPSVDYEQLRRKVINKGHTEDELNETLQKYLDMNVIMREDNVITIIEKWSFLSLTPSVMIKLSKILKA